eukprot:tig00000076_g2425.t1
MFTGLVEEMGKVKSLYEKDGGWILTIECSVVLEGVKLGDSIAVNGTCLTVTTFVPKKEFTVGMSPETMRRTCLGDLKVGDAVNLERSMAADSKFGGHFGHVDGTGTIVNFRKDGDSLWVTVRVSDHRLLKLIVPKGYVAVDGTSLTVCEVGPDFFSFMLVAYTQKKIIIPLKKVGQRVNLEADVVGKYIQRSLDAQQRAAGGSDGFSLLKTALVSLAAAAAFHYAARRYGL